MILESAAINRMVTWIVLSFSFVFTFAYPCSAEEIPAEIHADSLEYLSERSIFMLRGNVKVSKGNTVVTAEEAEYDERSARLRLRGNILLEDPDLLINANDAEIDTSGKTGVLNHSYLYFKKDNYHINARRVERKGEDKFIIEGVTFTTCDAPLPAWCFSAGSADVVIGDRLKAGNVVLKVKGVPVLYSPFLWAPILTDRKTGLLFPKFGFGSERGFFYRQPLFVVLSDNRDTTVTMDYYSKRGFGQGLEYRYVEQGNIQGQWNAYHIRDNKLNRHFLEFNGLHTQFRGEGFSHFINLNTVNDRIFYQEYGSTVQTRISRFLESTASVIYMADPVRFSISGYYWNDLREKDGTILQRLPRATINLRPVGPRPLMFSFDTEAINFTSEESYRVQRYSASPALHSSMGDALRLVQTARVVQSYYEIDNTDTFSPHTDRTLFEYDGGVSTAFFRKYEAVTHVIEPGAGYRYTTDSDYSAPPLDELETRLERSEVYLNLENRIITPEGTGLALRVEQPYDMRKTWHQWRPLEADLFIDSSAYATLEFGYDHYERGIAFLNGEAGYRTDDFHIGAGQRYTRTEDNLFYTGRLGFHITRAISLDNSIWYDARGGGVRDLSSSISYVSQCWGITVSYNRKPDGGYSVLLAFELKGLGDFSVGAL